MIKLDDFVLIEENDDIYNFKVRLSDNSIFTTIFSTNIPSICDIFKSYVDSKLEAYLTLENALVNLGTIILYENFYYLLRIVDKILDKNIRGVYFELDDKSIDGMKLVVDTREDVSNQYYNFFINVLFDSILSEAIKVIDSDSSIDNVINLFLSDYLLANLEDFYTGVINKDEFMNALVKEMEIINNNSNTNHMS